MKEMDNNLSFIAYAIFILLEVGHWGLWMNYLITEYLNTNWNINSAIEILCAM